MRIKNKQQRQLSWTGQLKRKSMAGKPYYSSKGEAKFSIGKKSGTVLEWIEESGGRGSGRPPMVMFSVDTKFWRKGKSGISWLDLFNMKGQYMYYPERGLPADAFFLSGRAKDLKLTYEEYYRKCVSPCSHAKLDMCGNTLCMARNLIKAVQKRTKAASRRRRKSAYGKRRRRGTKGNASGIDEQIDLDHEDKKGWGKRRACWGSRRKGASTVFKRCSQLAINLSNSIDGMLMVVDGPGKKAREAYKDTRKLRRFRTSSTEMKQNFDVFSAFGNVISSLMESTCPELLSAKGLRANLPFAKQFLWTYSWPMFRHKLPGNGKSNSSRYSTPKDITAGLDQMRNLPRADRKIMDLTAIEKRDAQIRFQEALKGQATAFALAADQVKARGEFIFDNLLAQSEGVGAAAGWDCG